MNGKRRNPNETDVKYVKSENISLVTGQQVRQFYADEDRDSYKKERFKLFQNNPSPPQHYRYVPESSRALNSKKSTNRYGFHIRSKNKKLISYCLIYVLMFTCAIILLYLFYTPKQMNLFGFYGNDNLRLKFYRFVLGRNASITTITPKIITTTEPTIYIIHSSTISSTTIKTKPFFTRLPEISHSSETKVQSSTTSKPMITKATEISLTSLVDDEFERTTASILSSTSSSIEFDMKDNKIDGYKDDKSYTTESSLNKIKSKTTCITINVTESTEPSINRSQSSSTTVSFISSSTKQPINKLSSTKPKSIDNSMKTIATSSTAIPTTLLPKDNSTETIKFDEKFSYSNTQLNSMDKNETSEDETIVDNGILPTEEEEEEKKRDELESKQKIAAFFGIDPVTGKEKDEKLNPLNSDRQQINFKNKPENDLMNKIASTNLDNNQKSNKWFLSSGQQFIRDNRDSINSKDKKEDEFKYHPMLKLLYRNCYGNCS